MMMARVRKIIRIKVMKTEYLFVVITDDVRSSEGGKSYTLSVTTPVVGDTTQCHVHQYGISILQNVHLQVFSFSTEKY